MTWNRTLAAILLVLAALPTATAKGEGCTLDVEQLCTLAKDAKFDVMFGDLGDIMLVVVGLFVVALVLVALVWVILHLKPSRLLKFGLGEKVKEVEPGGTARYKLEVENLSSKLPVDVFLERGDLPTGWSQETAVSVVHPSGFRVPQQIGETGSFTLSSEARGAHRAQVQLRIIAPNGAQSEETLDYEMRAIPVYRGKLRKGKAKKTRVTVLVTPHVPIVQITKVQHQPEKISVGNPVLTRAYLANKGDRDASDVAVSFSLNGQEIDKKIVPALSVQSEAEVEFHWTPQTGENRIRVAIAS